MQWNKAPGRGNSKTKGPEVGLGCGRFQEHPGGRHVPSGVKERQDVEKGQAGNRDQVRETPSR